MYEDKKSMVKKNVDEASRYNRAIQKFKNTSIGASILQFIAACTPAAQTPAPSAPTNITLSPNAIDENVPGEADVGTVTTTDSDSNSHSYTVSDSRFEIVGGQLRLKAGQSLDHEAEDTISVNVTATDNEGGSITKSFSIVVGDVNEVPTAISLNTNTINENSIAGVVGTLTTTDVDDGDSFSYVVSDNRFEVVGGQLKLKAGQSLNHEVEDTISINVTSTDSGGLDVDETFVITVNDVNEAPTNIALSANTTDENNTGAIIGDLTFSDEDAGDSVTYSVSDNRFEVVGGQLKLKAGQSLNHEVEDTVSVDVTATDSGGLDFTKSFSISVNDINETPTAISLNTNSVNENADGGAVGTLTTTDVDDGDSFSYVVSDNRFEVVGGQLKLKAGQSLNHEVEATVSIDVTSIDSGGLDVDETFVITVNDVNEAPTNIALSANVVAENAKGVVVGNLTTTDVDDGDNFSYTVSDDRFEVVGGQLKLKDNRSLDFEAGAPLSIDVTSTDSGGLDFTKSFSITITDLVDIFQQGSLIEGLNADDNNGYSVSGAGDVNGDGIADIIVSAVGLNSNVGGAYVIFGGANLATNIDLSALDGTNGFALNGIDADDYAGFSVSNAGDVNDDGIDDIIIGAAYANPSGRSDAGESYVVFGSNAGFAASVNLSALNGTNGFVINGISADDLSGNSVSYAGDVNDDGIADIIIGAPFANPNGNDSGQAYVIFGSNAGFAASLNLSALDGTNGFAINGVDADHQSGFSVSYAGDINDDGIDDIIIGAKFGEGNVGFSGAAYVVFGSDSGFSSDIDLSALDGTDGFKLSGIVIADNAGSSVSAAGDINGDGIGDIVIGAPSANPNGDNNSGEIYVVFGSDSGFAADFDLSSLDGTNGFTLSGIDADDFAGRSVSSAGDINGDGFDDILIHATKGSDSSVGEAYIVFGTDAGFAADINLSTLDGTNGFILTGIDAFDSGNDEVSGVGDVNDDGFDDIIISAAYADPNADSAAGESYIIFGHGGSWDATFDLSFASALRHLGRSVDETFTGTAEMDIFDMNVLNWGDDTILNFTDGVDLIDLSDTGHTFGTLTIIQNGSDTLITEAGADSIRINSMLATNITADDFIF